MNLIRYRKPMEWDDQLTSLRDEINRLFEAPFGDFGRPSEVFNTWAPALDLYEDEDSFLVKAEVPGMKKEEIEISVHNNVLTLSGERKVEREDKDAETSRAERFFGRFQRSISLPKQVDVAKASASYKDGILNVTLPKAAEARPKRVDVKVG